MENMQLFEQQAKEEATLADRLARKILGGMTYPTFDVMGGVPVKIAAKVFGKSETWVRDNLKAGILPIGTFTESENRTNIYISPKLLWEYTGFVYQGENK